MKLMFTAYPIIKAAPIGCPHVFEVDRSRPSRHNLFDLKDPTSKFNLIMMIVSIPFMIPMCFAVYFLFCGLCVK